MLGRLMVVSKVTLSFLMEFEIVSPKKRCYLGDTGIRKHFPCCFMRGFQDQITVMVRQRKTALWVTLMTQPHAWGGREGKEEGVVFLLTHCVH